MTRLAEGTSLNNQNKSNHATQKSSSPRKQFAPRPPQFYEDYSPVAFFGPVSSLGTHEPTYMLDTNICSYILKKNPRVLERFHSHPLDSVCISSIVLAELCFGVSHSQQIVKNRTSLDSFLGLVKTLPFDSSATFDYGEIRNYLQAQGTPIGPLDTLIAAHAFSQKLILVTNNLKEFSRVPGLKLENWAE